MTKPAGEPRPPTILGEHGEGYCRVCHFVVPLNYDGKLAQHWRGAVLASNSECKGSYGNPPKLTPFQSKLAAFSTVPPYAICHECKERVIITTAKVYGRHFRGIGAMAKVCEGTGRPVQSAKVTGEKDHSNERG